MNRRHMLTVALSGGVVAQVAGRNVAAAAAREQPRIQVIAKDGTRLFYRAFGKGPETLVFTSSWALDSRMWDYQVAHFASLGYRCITWDRRGQGRSDFAAGGYQMDVLADDLAALLAKLDLTNVTMVSHSMGAAETIRYLARHGSGRIRKVALIAPAAPFLLRTESNPYGAPQAVYENLWAQYARDFPSWVYANQPAFFTPDTPKPLQEAFTRQLLEVSVPVAIASHRALVTTDLRSDLPKIDRPVLILHGDRDASAPLAITGQRVAAGIRGAQLKVYEGAPHGIWVTHLDRVNHDLEAFLGR